MTTSIRAFLAVDPSPEVHNRLVETKSFLADSGAAVRWVHDDGLHVTIKFLGPTEPDTLDRLHILLQSLVSGFRPFPVHMHGLGAFPNLRQPRIVWAGISSEQLPHLASEVEKATASLGFEPERRAFRPHLTLRRVKGTQALSSLQALVEARRDEDFGVCTITELAAYRSDLRPTGAIYTRLWTIPFEG